MEFAPSDLVNMYINGYWVAIGSMCEKNGMGHCSSVKIAKGHVFILNDLYIKNHVTLSFPIMDSSRL